jgi:hypothetical protein
VWLGFHPDDAVVPTTVRCVLESDYLAKLESRQRQRRLLEG